MNIKYIIIGLFFLLNPNVNIIDVLPDLIGCAFILRGIMNCTELNQNFKSAYVSFKRLLWIEIVKIPCLLLYFIVGSNDMVWYLIFSFAFGVFEIALFAKAFAAMFDGIAYTSIPSADTDEYDALVNEPSIGDGKKAKLPAKGSVDYVRLLTIVFVAVKAVFCILPDLTLLSTGTYGEVTENGIFSWADYRDIFTALACAVVLIFGVYWFVTLRKYFKGLSENKEYMKSLKKDYEDALGKDSLFILKKKLYFAFSSFIIGAIFCVSLNLDGINYLPRALCGVMFAIACYSLIPIYNGVAKKAFKFSVIYAIISFVIWVYNLYFVLSFFLTHLANSDEGLAASFAEVLDAQMKTSFDTLYLFYGSVLLAIVEAVFMIILLNSIRKLLKNIINDHTGSSSGDIFHPAKSLLILLEVTIVFGVVCAVCVPIQTALSALLPDFWLVEFLARAMFIALMIILVVKIKEEFKTKYYID